MATHTHKSGQHMTGEYKRPCAATPVRPGGYTAPRKAQVKCRICADIPDRREKPDCPACERPYMREKRAGLEYVESLPRVSRLVVPA